MPAPAAGPSSNTSKNIHCEAPVQGTERRVAPITCCGIIGFVSVRQKFVWHFLKGGSDPGLCGPLAATTPTPEPYVDVKRAALYLAVAVKTLNEWARLQKIPAYQWGDGVRKTWRFKLSELDEWMGRRINSVRRPPLSERSVRREKEAH